MSSLPALLQFSDYILSHAGIDPEKPIENQNEHDLLWNKDPQRWLKKPPLGKIVIHGHVPIGEIETKGPWINLDTGAYATGRLSALCLSSDSEPRLLNVSTKM
jgi:serine/threonine protein phosphatase 1